MKGIVISFLLGLWVGARAGQEGVRKIGGATMTMIQSGELKSGMIGVVGKARGVVEQGVHAARNRAA